MTQLQQAEKSFPETPESCVLDLITLWEGINRISTTDPLTALIHAIVWLDPISIHTDYGQYTVGELLEHHYHTRYPDTAIIGLTISQQAFPKIYAQAIINLRNGDNFDTIGEFIMHQIESDYGIPLSSYNETDAYMYGIVPPKWGADPFNSDWLIGHRNEDIIRKICKHAGAETNQDNLEHHVYNMSIEADKTIEYVINSIYDEVPPLQNTTYEHIIFALAYLTQSTGILPLDLPTSFEDEYEFSAPWEPDEAERMRELTDQAIDILNKIYSAFDTLQNNTVLQNRLITNLKIANQYIRQLLKKSKGKTPNGFADYKPQSCRLQWHDIDSGT